MARSRDRDEDRYDDDLPRRRRDSSDRDEDDDLPRRRRDRSDPDEDDRPRRRSREPIEEDDDRPRRRRDRFEDDDEDGPPRRRKREYDDDEDDRPRRRSREPRSSPFGSMVLWIWVIIGGVAILGLGIGLTVYLARWSALRSNMSAYLAPATGRPTVSPPAGPKKMVVVDVDRKDIDWLHTYLSSNEQATTPAQVTYVAQCRWQTNKVLSYTGGGSGYRYDLNVSVIDLTTGQQVAHRHFAGSQPPMSFRGRRGESRYGSKPHDEVLVFLRGFAGR